MIIWTLARKDLRGLVRDPKAVIILLVMPLLFILVLGVSLGQKADDRLRVTLVDLDRGPPPGPGFTQKSWAEVVRDDLQQTAGIRVEILTSREEAERLVSGGRRAAVLVFGPKFSEKVGNSSFLDKGINPFNRDGVNLGKLDVTILRDPTQLTAASIIEQVAQ